MIKIIEGYEPKNKRLVRLGHKARLQIVLNGTVPHQMLVEIKDAVGCGNCKYYSSSKGLVLNKSTLSCRKVGEKTKKYARVITSITQNGNPYVVMEILYCCQFEEKKD